MLHSLASKYFSQLLVVPFTSIVIQPAQDFIEPEDLKNIIRRQKGIRMRNVNMWMRNAEQGSVTGFMKRG